MPAGKAGSSPNLGNDAEQLQKEMADLMRVSSRPARLRDLTYADLAEIDVGSWFDPAFADERIGTLQEAIDIARGRIKLNIELKFNWADPTLTPAVASIVNTARSHSRMLRSARINPNWSTDDLILLR